MRLFFCLHTAYTLFAKFPFQLYSVFMPDKIATTHVLMDNALVLYRRERSNIWQCRYKIDGAWQRTTTKEQNLAKAKIKARELLITAEIRKRDNLPVITRKFRHVAKLAIQRMRQETINGNGKASFIEYESIIKNYLIPFFGNHSITSITHNLIYEFNTWRNENLHRNIRNVNLAKTPKPAAHSTILNHNAALNRVFDEAINHGFLTAANRPKLENKGKASERRPAFEMLEVQAMISYFPDWIEHAVNDKSKELRHLLCNYVHVLLDTGARPGKELMNLKWKQIKYAMDMQTIRTGIFESDENEPWMEEPEEVIKTEWNRSCEMTVTGKTGTRIMLGMDPTIKALSKIILRNYGIENKFKDPLKGMLENFGDEYVFRTKDKKAPTSFQNLFEQFLREHELLVDPSSDKDRVFYSLRHTYATLALTHDNVPIHTLAKQMGTSVPMIERHYSHLKVVNAIAQLRNYETRRLIEAGSVIEHKFVPKVKK